jgi:hypothetical protein
MIVFATKQNRFYPRGKPIAQSARDAWATLRRREYVGILSKTLNTSRAAISKWKQVPESRLDDVSRILGIPRNALRPDLDELQTLQPPDLNEYLATLRKEA